MNITVCTSCKRKYDYDPKFCNKMRNGILCVSEHVGVRKTTSADSSRLTTTVRIDDRFGDRVIFLSDVMDTNETEDICNDCSDA